MNVPLADYEAHMLHASVGQLTRTNPHLRNLQRSISDCLRPIPSCSSWCTGFC